MNFITLLLITFLIGTLNPIQAENWSNWLGPNYNGSVEGVHINLPTEGNEFKVKWKIPIGSGWSSPVMDKKFIYFHDRVGEDEIVHCLNIKTGDEIWQNSYFSGYRDDFGMGSGPRSTPAFKNGIIVTHGPQGLLHGLDLKTGIQKWVRDLKKEFGSPKGFFGRCASPLIIGDRVILDVGGEKVGLVAFSLIQGRTQWFSKPYGNDYSSPVPFFSEDRNFCLSFMRKGFLAVDLKTGNEEYFAQFRSPIDASVNAATPLVIQNQVLLSSCYGVGAGLWQYQENNGKNEFPFKEVWRKNEVIDCHYSTPVSFGDYIYGFHGRQERKPILRCIRVGDGEIMWAAPSMGAGNLIRVSGKLIVLLETGELVILKALPESCEIVYRQQILGAGTRAHFSFANGLLVARDKRRLICLQICK
jgi:outer membrane protein assembly factor BamB